MRKLLGGALALAALSVVLASPAGAQNVWLAGSQLLDQATDPCAELDPPLQSLGTFDMNGSLVGCWYTPEVTSFVITPGGPLHAAGTELFVGCLDTSGDGECTDDDVNGTLSFTFTYTAAQFGIPGRCHHPIVGGTDEFAGATGVIEMRDRANGTVYWGHIAL